MKAITALWSILTATEQKRAVALVGLMLFSMFLEMLGIGLVVPALTAMMSESPVTPGPYLGSWLAWLGSPSRTQLLLGGLLFFLALYAFKAVFVLFVNWRQLRFVEALQDRIAYSLFGAYLSQPWTYHLKRNSAEMIRVINDIAPFAGTCVAVLGAIAEVLVVLGVMALLVWIEPVGAITVGSLMVFATYVLDRVTKRRLVHWGTVAQHQMTLAFKHLYQGFGGVKEVKVLGCEQTFVDQYCAHRRQHVRMFARQSFVSCMPRLWYELLAIASLCTLTAVMLWQGKTTQSMIPTLGLFAAASFRLMPSVNRLSFALHGIRYAEPNITTIQHELGLQPKSTSGGGSPVLFTSRVALEEVVFRYPEAHANSLDHVSLDIPHGTAVGIVGGSGAGKSTLVDVILGLLSPTAGRVTVDGVDVAPNVRNWQKLIGYVPQTIYLCDDTIRRNVAFGIPDDRIDDGAVARALRAAQLDDFIARLPSGVETMVGEQGVRLSGGQRQRIGIARALYHDPQVLVLDEATSALDTETEKEVMKAVNALHGAKTLIIVAHRLSTIANCDRIYGLEHGHVVKTGTYAEVIHG